MQSIAVNKNKMIDKKEFSFDSMLYRFRSDSEYNFDALLKNEMFAATPNILNDPLDCPITYNPDKLYKKLLRRKNFAKKYAKLIFPSSLEKREPSSFESYKEYQSYYDSIYQEARTKLFDCKYASVVKGYICALATKIIYKVRECFGIVSFSLTYGSGVMWSHYASNYKGFVVAYNLLEFNETVNTLIEKDYFLKQFREMCGLYKINYVSTEEIVDGTDLMYEIICKNMSNKYKYNEMMDFILETKHKDLLIKLLTTKDKSWDYEKEVRLIFPREELRHSLYNLFGNAIPQYFKISDCYYPNGVIIGSNMSNVNRAAVGNYCLNNKLVILQRINTERLMSERVLFLTLVKPQELIKN